MTGAISARLRRAVLAAAAATALAAGLLAVPASAAGPQRPAATAAANPNPSNPLANITWGNYTDASLDPVFNAYGKATGNDKTLLGKIAFKPRRNAWSDKPLP